MRIQNLLKAKMFYPYAGVNANRGCDLAPDGFSSDIEATRFFNPLLQRDWKAGKIALCMGDADAAVLGDQVISLIRDYKVVNAVDVIELSKSEVPEATDAVSIPASTPAPPEEASPRTNVVTAAGAAVEVTADNVDKIALTELNKPLKRPTDLGMPIFDGKKATSKEISKHMGDLV